MTQDREKETRLSVTSRKVGSLKLRAYTKRLQMFLPCTAKDNGDPIRGEDGQKTITHLNSGMIARDRPVLLKRNIVELGMAQYVAKQKQYRNRLAKLNNDSM